MNPSSILIPPAERNGVRKILLVRADSIGDNVLSSPLLAPLSELFPKSEITILCQDHIRELYEHCPYVKQTIGFNWDKLLSDEPYRESVVASIRSYGADLLLNPIYSRDPVMDFLASHSPAKIRIAFEGDPANVTAETKKNTSALYTSLISSPSPRLPELTHVHEFLAALGYSTPLVRPTMWLSDGDRIAAEKLVASSALMGRPIISIFPSAKWAVKDYPHFGEALRSTNLHSSHALLFLGSERDSGYAEHLLSESGFPGLVLAGKCTFRVSSAVVARSRLSVGSDTSLGHAACAVGTPNVIVLGGGHFGRFFPYSPLTSVVCLPMECYYCNLQCRHSKPWCVQEISPYLVAQAIQDSIRAKSVSPRIYAQKEWGSLPKEARPTLRVLDSSEQFGAMA